MGFSESMLDLSRRLTVAVEKLAGIGERSVGPTGWASYVDGQYPTAGVPFALVADTDTVIPNDALGSSTNETQLPDHIEKFYDGVTKRIPGRVNDGFFVTLDMFVVPTNASSTFFDTWIDVGSPVGQLYRKTVAFPKGQDQILHISDTVAVYSLETWQSNGGQIKMRSNGTCNVYGIRFVFHHLHKGVPVDLAPVL